MRLDVAKAAGIFTNSHEDKNLSCAVMTSAGLELGRRVLETVPWEFCQCNQRVMSAAAAEVIDYCER